MEFQHKSVLLQEAVEGLKIKADGVYVDGTLGGGGHAYEICQRLSPQGRLIGIDQDADAVQAASDRLIEFQDRIQISRNNFSRMGEVLSGFGILKVDGILLDLGVSSYQLDDPQRGFAYRMDAPLDMRMDKRQKFTARDLVNTYSEEDLCRIIREYGEDKFARNIARRIVLVRAEKEIQTTGELVAVIRAAVPARAQKGGGHPAKRTFQAIRIELNQELEVLKDFPFLRGQDCEGDIPQKRKTMYLPQQLPRMCMWEGIPGKGDYQKTNPPDRRGAFSEPARQKRKTQSI